MLACYAHESAQTTPIYPILPSQLSAWLSQQRPQLQQWVKSSAFRAEAGAYCLLPTEEGGVEGVLFGVQSVDEFWVYGELPRILPAARYRLEIAALSATWSQVQWQQALMAWGLGSYQFDLYREAHLPGSSLAVPAQIDYAQLESVVSSIYLLRDLINTPTEALGPVELAQAVSRVAEEFGATLQIIVGDELLTQNYPLIHAVGRAASQAPRLIDLRWGKSSDPRVTLVGKGVCYDTGGLSIKTTSGMLSMKKDMGGAAHALALARLIMSEKLPLCLRLLIPAVENSISSNSYRPGDVIVARNGLSVEITNTDAEGRLVLADALAEASSENPEILIDFATLTGAARTALGPDLPALFSNSDAQAETLLQAAEATRDPVWRLPLHEAYRELYLHSSIADIANASSKSYAGAILAALFLQLFVNPKTEWTHLDVFAFNEAHSPGRPCGGEAMGLRACFEYLKKKYQK